MTLDEIKDRINELSDGDRAEVAAWLLSVDREAWDRQIEADFSPGGAGKKLLDEVDAAMKENANKIERFFREYVNGWLLGDIQLCCAQEKPLPFLVSITVFCGIDFLAGLLEGKDSGGTGFTHFIEQFFGPEYGRFAKELWKDFRCGLVHEYFPKRQGEVTWGDPTKHLTDFQARLCLD